MACTFKATIGGKFAPLIGHSYEDMDMDTMITTYNTGPGFDTRSGNIISFLLPLFQEGQLSVTGESMCTKYWLTA